MDPLSHVVIGRALTAAFDDDARLFGRLGTAAILGALAPDVDGILIPFGWDLYLRVHEIGTHSIAGGLLAACATAAIVRAVARRARWLPLAAAATAGAMSHLALDVLSGARIRLAWPVVDARMSAPLIAMADPWFMAICVAAVFAWCGRPPSRYALRRDSLRPTAARQAEARSRARAREGWTGVGPRAERCRGRLVARAVLAAAAALLCVKGALLFRTIHSASVPMTSLSTLDARWGSFTEWTAYERTPAALRTWLVNSRGRPPALILSHPLEAESALVQESRSLASVRNFLRTHDFGFPVERSSDGMTSVLWSDLRYCRPTTPSPDSIACALWFGGVFGPDGRVVTQEVKVGSWIQRRPASR
jgi:membrane-bound metal-dependent hydrolase YbcI (DUF457 family)